MKTISHEKINLNTKILLLSPFKSIYEASKLIKEKDVEYIILKEKSKIIGVLPCKALMGYHLNRLLIDCASIQPLTLLYEKDLSKKNIEKIKQKNIPFILILENKTAKIKGLIDIQNYSLKKELLSLNNFVQQIDKELPTIHFFHPVVITDKNLQILSVNSLFLKLSGYEHRSEVINRSIKTIIKFEKINILEHLKKTHCWIGKGNMITKNNKKLTIQLIGYIPQNLDKAKSYIIFSIIDIENGHKIEKHILAKEKFTATLNLASGIAHEFNNILTIIMGHSQICLQEKSIEEIKKSLEIIEKSSIRGQEVVKDLVEFAKNSWYDFKLKDLKTIINRVINQNKSIFKQYNITTTKQFPSQKVIIVCDEEKLSLVFQHLFTNAIHAIILKKNKGEINIKLKKLKKFAHLEISDNGIGIPSEIENKIFEPFFTTKGAFAKTHQHLAGKGLGLSIVYTIINAHNGNIDFKSTSNKGTTFYLKFPIITI